MCNPSNSNSSGSINLYTILAFLITIYLVRIIFIEAFIQVQEERAAPQDVEVYTVPPIQIDPEPQGEPVPLFPDSFGTSQGG